MGTVTYPHAAVAEFVTERFVPIKFNITEHHPDFKEALGRGKVLWGPLLVFLDGRGSELLRLVLGLAALTHGKIEEALSWFAAASDAYPKANAAPEALYWAAAAVYKSG